LGDQGYLEGKNLIIERRYSSSKLKDNANELAGMKLDAILTTCTPSTRIMKEATSSTPIVRVAVSDPVRQGLIASLATPGRTLRELRARRRTCWRNGSNYSPLSCPSRRRLPC